MDANERAARIEIVEQYGGILPFHIEFYREAIRNAAESSFTAFGRFEVAAGHQDHQQTYLALREALVHAAALSRFFWPARIKNKLHRMRAERLWEIFEMGQESPLQQRQLRDALEHFDEKLDEFLLWEPTGIILPGPIIASHERVDDPVGSVFRLVDPDARIFAILGQKYEFGPLAFEVKRVLDICRG